MSSLICRKLWHLASGFEQKELQNRKYCIVLLMEEYLSLGPNLRWSVVTESWSKECSECTLWAPPRQPCQIPFNNSVSTWPDSRSVSCFFFEILEVTYWVFNRPSKIIFKLEEYPLENFPIDINAEAKRQIFVFRKWHCSLSWLVDPSPRCFIYCILSTCILVFGVTGGIIHNPTNVAFSRWLYVVHYWQKFCHK